VAASSRTSWSERLARIVFGVVVVPFFGGLSLLIAVARARTPPDVVLADLALVAITLFLG